MKRFVISIAMLLEMAIVVNAAVTKVTISDIEYTLDLDNKTAVVEDIKSMAHSLIIPDTVEYYSYKFAVKSISSIKSSQVKELRLPNTLNDTLNDVMNGNKYIMKVYCPPHITYMQNTFDGCIALEDVVLPVNLKYAKGVFSGCKALKACVLPDNLEVMNGTFFGCTSLESVVLPKDLKVLKGSVFENCVSLKNIELPESLDSIFGGFSGATLIKRLDIPNSVRYIKKNAFEGSYIESVNIPLSLVVKDFNTSNFLLIMENLKEIRIDANDEKFEWKNGVVFYNNNGEHEVWYAKNVNVLKLPNYSNVNINYKAILSCISEVIVPNTCVKFTYKGRDNGTWARDPQYGGMDILKKLTIEEGLTPLALSLSACGETAFVDLYIHRPIVPINGFNIKYMITFSEQQHRTTTLYLDTNSSTTDLSKLYEPWSWYNGKPSMYTFHSYGPDVLGFDENVVKIMPDFRLNFVETGDLKTGTFTPNKIHTVKCYGMIPPFCENKNGLTSIDATLYVPKGAWPEYVTHPFWGLFSVIQEMESVSGVEDVIADESNDRAVEVARYDVNGKLLVSPVRGLNIVKLSNGKVRKEFVK